MACMTSITPCKLIVDNINGLTEIESELRSRLRGTGHKDI